MHVRHDCYLLINLAFIFENTNVVFRQQGDNITKKNYGHSKKIIILILI